MTMSNFDKLKGLKPKMNVEKTIHQILNIIKNPHNVYGHGVGSLDDIEKITQEKQSHRPGHNTN